MPLTCVVVDYSKGNLRSVQKGLELAGAHALISADAAAIRSADALVLPGVGSFADASEVMLATGQMQALSERLDAGVPFLGICLGMQLLFEYGNEGMPEGSWAEGLGILSGRCTRIASTDSRGAGYKVPHVGWNQVSYVADVRDSTGTAPPAQTAYSHVHTGEVRQGTSPLFDGVAGGSHFYFTHSYGCEPAEPRDVVATVTHARVMPAAVCKGRAYGVQFHPEKSSDAGLAVMKNFVRLAQTGHD
ncbi:MAG: imidazole glycerol phosphate synthase subunit HisH [Coriobacteriales bacterium]|jgi:glutamine amidotransferase|nr:imidazole glycerol phosphate synthase subunit HisH [Coriobacteriales bacterium]